MMRNFIRWCLPLFGSALFSTLAYAQETTQDTNQAPSFVPYYALALLGVLIVLVVVFKPSNKDW